MGQPTTITARAAAPAAVRRLSGVAAQHWPLILLVLVGLGLRLWMLSVNTLDPRFSNADDGDYYRRALRFAVTGQYIDDSWLIRPPLHVLFFALWLKIALWLGQPQLGVALVQAAQVVLSLLMVPIGYGVARRMFASRAAGLLFAGFLSCWFPLVEQPTVLFSELLYLLLFLLHVWLLLRYDETGRLRELALSGLALGAAALTRSPALYSVAFVGLWLLARLWDKRRDTADGSWRALLGSVRPVLGSWLVVLVCCLAVVLPWTMRNYLVYQRLIPIDTLGQINLWLDLDAVAKRNEHIETLRRMPQADRAGYAMERAREILAEDPLKPFRGMWPTFQHIWKAQFVEDYYVKQSFFGRPLRPVASLGLLGDLIWLVFTVAGLIGLVGPLREGLRHRLFVLAWVGYSLLTVLLFHVEPRYLVPLWTLIGLYGAGALARLPALRRARPALVAVLLPLAATIAFVWLLVSYRDYPAIIARGVAREAGMAAGERAYRAGDYPAAAAAYGTALEAQPNFVDAQVGRALALLAQGRLDEAEAALANANSRQALLVSGAVARAQGRPAQAADRLTHAEEIAGEDMQRWSLDWLRLPPQTALRLGEGLDLGYIAGFSGGEYGPTGGFRWLEGRGRIELPLAAPLRQGATVQLRLGGGLLPATPLELRVGDGPVLRVDVPQGAWRVYHVPVPDSQLNQPRLSISLRAPTFVPALALPNSDDARALSLMVSDVRIRE
ncbi:MAG TPA: tetratricopeptide repeat protein [Roseiflexaceae bacterium]|nr:tetratricopeptide repeat protein [Roseiflexaceae bacterium]